MEHAIPFSETLTVEFNRDRKRLPDTELVKAVVCLVNAEGDKPTGLHPDHRIPGLWRIRLPTRVRQALSPFSTSRWC